MNLITSYSNGNNFPIQNDYQVHHGNNTNYINNEAKDTVSFNELFSKYSFVQEKSNGCTGVFAGELNGQESIFKRTYDNEMTHYEGTIGNKKFLLTSIIGHSLSTGKTVSSYTSKYEGEYNGKSINLNIEVIKSDSPSKLKRYIEVKRNEERIKEINITGKIGDKDISLKLPNTEVPKDQDVKDILAFTTGCECISLGVTNGKIRSISYDEETSDFINKKRNEETEKIKQFPAQVLAFGTTILNTILIIMQLKKPN